MKITVDEAKTFQKVLGALGNSLNGNIEILVTELQDQLLQMSGRVLTDSDNYSVALGAASVIADAEEGNEHYSCYHCEHEIYKS